MAYDKEVSSGQITLSNSKLEVSLAYKSSRSYIYIEKYTRNESDRRLDFAVPEAMPIITMLIETSNTGNKVEYIYPSGRIKFVSSVHNNYITIQKYELKNNHQEKPINSMKIHLNEMPAVISLIHRALTASATINWQNVEPIIPPLPPSADAQAILDELFPNRYK